MVRKLSLNNSAGCFVHRYNSVLGQIRKKCRHLKFSEQRLEINTYDRRTTPRNLCCCLIQSCTVDGTMPSCRKSLKCTSLLQHDRHRLSQHPVIGPIWTSSVGYPMFHMWIYVLIPILIIPLQREAVHQSAYRFRRCWWRGIASLRCSLPSLLPAWIVHARRAV